MKKAQDQTQVVVPARFETSLVKAFHEGAHAMVAADAGLELKEVTMSMPADAGPNMIGLGGGAVAIEYRDLPDEENPSKSTKVELIKRAYTLLAGSAADSLLKGGRSPTIQTRPTFVDIANSYVTTFDDSENIAIALKPIFPERAERLYELKIAYFTVLGWLESNWATLEALADALQKRGTLSGDSVHEIMGNNRCSKLFDSDSKPMDQQHRQFVYALRAKAREAR